MQERMSMTPARVYSTTANPTATPIAATTSAAFTRSTSPAATYPSPGPYAPFPPPGEGAPPELPPPSTLGFAVGRLLVAVAALLDVPFPEFAAVPFPDTVEFPEDTVELPVVPDAVPDAAADADADAVLVGCSVTTFVTTCVAVWRFESRPTLVLTTVDTALLCTPVSQSSLARNMCTTWAWACDCMSPARQRRSRRARIVVQCVFFRSVVSRVRVRRLTVLAQLAVCSDVVLS